MRAYGTNLQTWGGDPDCEHRWEDAPYVKKHDNGRDFMEPAGKWVDHKGEAFNVQTSFCTECNAWLGELGSEPSIELFIQNLVEIFREVKRVLHPSGTCWVNLGDSYAGSGRGPTGESGIGDQSKRQGFSSSKEQRGGAAHDLVPDGLKAKDMCLIPEQFAIALQRDGWWVRSKIAWVKPAAMPEAVTDRPSNCWEIVWLLTKEGKYFYDADAVRIENETTNRNLRNFWDDETVPSDSWKITPQHFDGEYCFGCETLYDGEMKKQLSNQCGKCGYLTRKKVARIRDFDGTLRTPCPSCGREDVKWERYCPKCQDNSQWVEHFAAFPPKLVEQCVKAGTSEHGVCATCKAPWRILDQAWVKGCSCLDATRVPSVVLDIFSGTGTTVLVAKRLGRAGLGIELNEKFHRFSVRRVLEDMPLFDQDVLVHEQVEQAALI